MAKDKVQYNLVFNKKKKKNHLNLHESAFRHHNNSIMHSMEVENLFIFFFLAKMTSENDLDDNKQKKEITRDAPTLKY